MPPPGGNFCRRYPSILFLLFFLILLLGIISRGLLTLRQRCRPTVIADGQVALSRGDLDLTVHIPHNSNSVQTAEDGDTVTFPARVASDFEVEMLTPPCSNLSVLPSY